MLDCLGLMGLLSRSLWRPLALLMLPLFMSNAAGAEPAVTGIRLGVQAEGTRVVLDLTSALEYTIFTLADPYRVVIDLPEVEWRLPGTSLAVGRGNRVEIYSVPTSNQPPKNAKKGAAPAVTLGRTIYSHRDLVQTLAFSPDGKYLASGE